MAFGGLLRGRVGLWSLVGQDRETVTIERPGGTDKWGQKLPSTEHTSEGWGFAPTTGTGGQRSSTEDNYQHNTVIRVSTGYGPPDADVADQDVIRRADGTRWQVEGDPGRWRNPLTGWPAGTEVSLRRVTG